MMKNEQLLQKCWSSTLDVANCLIKLVFVLQHCSQIFLFTFMFASKSCQNMQKNMQEILESTAPKCWSKYTTFQAFESRCNSDSRKHFESIFKALVRSFLFHSSLRPFMNDVTHIWTFYDPHPSPLGHRPMPLCNNKHTPFLCDVIYE